MSADSAMKCTPQKTTNSADFCPAAFWKVQSCHREVGEINHRILLIMMAQNQKAGPKNSFAD